MSRITLLGAAFATGAGLALLLLVSLDIALLSGYGRQIDDVTSDIEAVEDALLAAQRGVPGLLTGLRLQSRHLLDPAAVEQFEEARNWAARYDRALVMGEESDTRVWNLRRSKAELLATRSILHGRRAAEWAALGRHIFLMFVLGFALASIPVLRDAWHRLEREAAEAPSESAAPKHATIIPLHRDVRRAA